MSIGAAGPTLAQTTYYVWDGAVAPTPADATNPTFVVSGSLLVGNAAQGSFSALAGAQLTADQVAIGNGQSGSGTMTITGNTTLVKAAGSSDRMNVGAWGAGTLTVSGGAVLDASLDTAGCAAGSCRAFVGNAAGSTGTLTITGAGSEVRTARSFTVGQTTVYTTAGSGFDFGTPGGTTNAFVDVLDGGTLRTQLGSVGFNNAGPNGLGSEKANGTVTVDGAGSAWIVTRDSIDNTVAALGIGVNAGATGLVTISGGGSLLIDGSGSPGPNDGINVGRLGGKGTLVVTGAGSTVATVGVNPFINAGGNSEGPAEGSFQVLAGAAASTLYLNIGRNGGTGTMLIDGAGSTLTQSGVGSNQSPGINGPASAQIGSNQGLGGATGLVTVSNGGQWIISDGGGDGRASQVSPGIVIGRGASSTGSLTITGPGSKVEITSNSLNPGVGVGDNYNPFVAIGFDNAATTSGTLMISNGGKLVINGNAVSTVANPRTTSLNIGGRSGTAATGTATVTGNGSEIVMNGYDALINVGREAGASGTLNVLSGGKVSGMSVAIGVNGSGTVNIDGGTIALAGDRSDSSQVGAGMTVGRGATGVAVLNMRNGASLTFSPNLLAGGGMAIGGDQFLAGGSGTVIMSGGSSIAILSGPSGGMTIGRSGTGTLVASGNSSIDLGLNGGIDFGRDAGGNGSMTLNSGSTLRSNSASIGGNSDTGPGGIGSVTVDGLGSEFASAGASGFIGVGRGGGQGTLTVQNQGKVSAIVLSVGRGTGGGSGTLDVDNGTVNLAGQQTSGNQAGAALAVGTGSGSGSATFANGSALNIGNLGSAGAGATIGGSSSFPGGTGTLSLSGASHMAVTAATGAQANVIVGRDGTGTLNLAGGSTLDVGSDSGGGFVASGNVYVGLQAGGVGRLNVSGGSAVNAGFVGVGVSAAGTGKSIGTPGGTGLLVLADGSSINAPRFELGAGSTLSGNGDINAGPGGQVVIAGTISPGNSPGRIRIRCDVTMLFGSQLILEVDGTGADVEIDQLVIDSGSTFDLTKLQIIFAFVGDTNPEAMSLDLNEFLRAGTPGSDETSSLASLFGSGQDWGNVVDSGLFAFRSSVYDVTSYTFNPETGQITGVEAAAVPEPTTLALVLAGLVVMARRRAVGRR